MLKFIRSALLICALLAVSGLPCAWAGEGKIAAQSASADEAQAFVQQFAADVVRARDALGQPFAVLDKSAATLWVFNAQGRVMARTPALVGRAVGDVAPPDIGTRPLSQVQPAEKVTPAGRFEAEGGVNSHGEDIVWLDYDQAMSMHRVRNVRGEERFVRIRNPDPRMRRISFGCVNLPAAFYDRYIDPLFAKNQGVVYVLPEVLPLAQVFPFERAGR